MAFLSFFLGTMLPGILGLILAMNVVRDLHDRYRRAVDARASVLVASLPRLPWTKVVCLALLTVALLGWVTWQTYQVHQCEKWGQCDDAPAWCRDGLHELRAKPHGCRDWGPVGCREDADGGTP